MLSDGWLPRYRLLENFTIKWNGNGNAHGNGNGDAFDRGDYNSSFALRAVELKMTMFKRYKEFFFASFKGTFLKDSCNTKLRTYCKFTYTFENY